MSQGRRPPLQPPLFVDTAHIYAHIPQDPFYQALAAELDLTFVYDLTAPLYAPVMGRPSLDPVVFFKALLFGFFEGIGDEVTLELRLAESITARRFLGYGLEERTPDESTLRKTRQRFKEEVFQAVFTRVLEQCAAAGLVRGRAVGIDSTPVEANASLQRLQHKTLQCTYQEYLAALRASDGPAAVQAALAAGVANADWASPTDPDARITGMKHGGIDLAYKVDLAVDLETGVIVAAGAESADLSDRNDVLPWVDAAVAQIDTLGGTLTCVVTDKGYHSGEFLAELADRGLTGVVSSPHYAAGPAGFQRADFAYAAETDTLTCPAGQTLRRSVAEEKGRNAERRVYRARGAGCRTCAHFGTCTRSRTGRVVTMSIYAAEIAANAIRAQSPAGRTLRQARGTRGEAPFGYFKQFGGLQRMWGHGLDHATKRVLVAAAGWNLLKLVKARLCAAPAACGSVLAAAWTVWIGRWPAFSAENGRTGQKPMRCVPLGKPCCRAA